MTQEIISVMAVKMLEIVVKDNLRISLGPGDFDFLDRSWGLKRVYDRLFIEAGYVRAGSEHEKERAWTYEEADDFKNFLMSVGYVYQLKARRGKRVLVALPDGYEFLADPLKKGLRLDFLRKNMPRLHSRMMVRYGRE